MTPTALLSLQNQTSAIRVARRSRKNSKAVSGKDMVASPPLLNAVGVSWRITTKGTTVYYWRPKRTAVGRQAIKKGWPSSSVRLHGSESAMAERAHQLQVQVEAFCANLLPIPTPKFNGLFGDVIGLYMTSEESGYAVLKYNVARTYSYWLQLLFRTHGERKLSELTRKDFFQWHKDFMTVRPDGKFRVARAYEAMKFVRRVLKFGIGLEISAQTDHCARLVTILSTMRFEVAAPRRQYLTFAHAVAFIERANELGFGSMALAQALQYETALRQKDVIGEWWANNNRAENRLRMERGALIETEDWASGLIWEKHISAEFVMAKPTSKSKFRKMAISDLTLCPLVVAELSKIPVESMKGPVILDESTGLPYRPNSFGQRWRKIANDVGIPSDIRNMDSRAGAITEGSEAGVDLELLRQFGTHSAKAMTQHYNRETLKKARMVHVARNAHRKAPDESRFDRGSTIDADQWSRQ